MKSEKIVTTNDNEPHFSDILITQSLNKHLFFKHLFVRENYTERVLKSSLV